jgi:hypothetical protein
MGHNMMCATHNPTNSMLSRRSSMNFMPAVRKKVRKQQSKLINYCSITYSLNPNFPNTEVYEPNRRPYKRTNAERKTFENYFICVLSEGGWTRHSSSSTAFIDRFLTETWLRQSTHQVHANYIIKRFQVKGSWANIRQLKIIHNFPTAKHELVPLVIPFGRMLRVIKLTSKKIFSCLLWFDPS